MNRLKSIAVADLLHFVPIAVSISAAIVLIDVFLQNAFQDGSDRSSWVVGIALGGIVFSGLWLFRRMDEAVC